ncbi:SDR family oxidoreductase [Muriicola sp. Z0-33]|uniref:SDR family oxidoreductase n=1 Tax=Muriicola sp. Z0-33 TaxID=2816957 RepID=UPI0022373FAD|nr:SDR family oxidoreductase [Muriicola sp. Z0-33]MCW5514753.1 SDR family oxidoreductase [Muriicola sp. Z0-33]
MKTILITGCSSGFGHDAAKYLAEKGHHVIATMRNIDGKNAQAAADLKNYASENGYKIDVLEIDVTSDDSVAKAAEQLPDIDVLINNAGLGFGGAVEAFTSQQCLDQLDLNIVGTLRVAKAVLPGMRARKSGLIIQVSSIAGRLAFPGFGVYHASKWGLEGLSESMRYELAPHGVDVVMVEPGPFSTNFFGNMIPASSEDVAQAYQHVTDFNEGFGAQVTELFESEEAPTDPMIVVKTFEALINLPPGQRPLRTIAGLDFGAQAANDAIEPIRKGALAAMEIADLDGPSPAIKVQEG